MPLAEGIDRYVALMREQRPVPGQAPGIETIRLLGDLFAPRFAQDYAPNVQRHDSYIAAPGREIAVRIFDPGGEGLRPALCYFHGGGFAFGSVESFDIVGAGLAEATGALVISVQYRRLPETDYAGAQADCDAAFDWLVRNAAVLNADPARLGVAGDSAGALLALACAANARDAGGVAPVCQLLFYGTFAMDPRPAHHASRDPLLTPERIQQYIALFRGNGGLARAPAPIDRADLSGLPPTHVVAAEHDPLCEEATAFVARLDQAGVAVSLQSARGMIHGFLRAIGVSGAAREELHRAAAAVRPWLWPGANA
ncbi:alpha/beta hydrolase [Hephaestia sp. GCM10023244]|uniref:alpha/beta hydrolase n=1 Tax=unclassified Hephaestia TaxID=2631281 RepID=UPI00207772B4|nr:alpha/beta hydrolase [Hephaestia sp. MAHUQ-44]MCM8732268.1 alpha/beta hydrolase [Hephaestia sp. MAHUQ-44]